MTPIYTVGGTVDSRHRIYVERRADDQLLKLCQQGDFAYILTSRQTGKSSLMIRTARQLRAEKEYHVATIDLTRLGVSNVSEEQWYLGLIEELGEQLGLDPEPLDYWETHPHLGYVHRFSRFIEYVVLHELPGQVIIFIDEIDSTLSLPFASGDFFAVIRQLYNARSQNPDLYRLGFVLIGVATPDDLIADPARTPFNIGTQVSLDDFTLQEAAPLQAGFPESSAVALLARVFDWTDGHPYLTQRLCAALAERYASSATLASPAEDESATCVDALVQQLFFDEQAEQDSNLDFVKNMLTRRLPGGVGAEELLSTYRQVWQEREPVQDEARSLIKNHLKLSGVVKRQGDRLIVRNRLYHNAFDRAWILANLPSTELRKQLWRQLRNVLAPIAVVIAVVFAGLALYAFRERKAAEDAKAAAVHAKAKSEEAQIRARSHFLSAGALLAAYAHGPYNGYADRAGLLALQALHVQEDGENTSNLLRTLQGVGALSNILQGHSGTVSSVAFSPDGQRVVSGSGDKTIRLWGVKTGNPLGEPWQAHSGTVSSVAFSPDGQRVVSGSGDKTIRLWGVKTGNPLGEPWQAHSGTVSSVAFSPDGQRVVSGSGDKTIRLWDVKTGNPLGEPWQGHSGTVSSVAFSPDGQRVMSGSGDDPDNRWDYMLLLWDVDKSGWRQRACRVAGRNFMWDEWKRYMEAVPYARTCKEYPAHPTVITAWLDEAAQRFRKNDTPAALQYYERAAQAAQESPVKYDMITLYLSKLEALQALNPAHPMIPRLREQIHTWVATQPEINQHYWQKRLVARPAGN